MKRSAFVLLLCVLALPGCSFKTKWHDTTGQNRGEDQVKADAVTCEGVAGVSGLNRSSTTDEFKAVSAKMNACMTDHGWELVRDRS